MANLPRPPRPVAGYLPYRPARFVSQAEQAAERLPATVKAQSLRNLLLRKGAKPVELEYAGIDDFIAQQGPTVSAADVLAHIKREGPLGQLKRVEQQVEDLPMGLPDGDPPRPPAYSPNFRQPFDPSTASNQTVYQDRTIPGMRGDFAGYREVLLEDPKNRPHGDALVRVPSPPRELNADDLEFLQQANRRIVEFDFESRPGEAAERAALVDAARGRGLHLRYSDDGQPYFSTEEWVYPGAIDAHSADYWARYNEYPDRIAVQNIQSDVGQARTNALLADPNMTIEQANDLIHRWDMGEIHADERVEQAGRMIGRPEFDPNFDWEADFVDERRPRGATSPLAKDDNWKNLMARLIALQSIAGGGKPITIPTGRQMVDVEGFGMRTHRDSEAAARAASSYNEDLVRRLQKIFRGLDPKGAEVIQRAPMFSEQWINGDYPFAALGADAPGWTIKPSPEAVRAALDRGLPIMSLAPLLLAPALEEQ